MHIVSPWGLFHTLSPPQLLPLIYLSCCNECQYIFNANKCINWNIKLLLFLLLGVVWWHRFNCVSYFIIANRVRLYWGVWSSYGRSWDVTWYFHLFSLFSLWKFPCPDSDSHMNVCIIRFIPYIYPWHIWRKLSCFCQGNEKTTSGRESIEISYGFWCTRWIWKQGKQYK